MLGRSVKAFITSLGIKAKTSPKIYEKSRYAIGNVSKKDLSKIIREWWDAHHWQISSAWCMATC